MVLRRYDTKRLLSGSVDYELSFNNPVPHINKTESDSLLTDRWHQRRSAVARTYPVIASGSHTITNRFTQRGRIEKVAGFHSSPLSWFASEAGGVTSTEDAATAASSEEAPPADNDSNDEPSATDISYDVSPPPPLSQASQDKVQAIFEKVLWLDMIEVHLLTQIVNEQMGISWRETEQRKRGGGIVAQKAAVGGAAGAEEAEEKTIFDLKLIGFDAKAKIKVIKEVRTIAGLGLKEAKEMVEGAPKVIQKELKQEKAEELKTQLESVGAQVELV